MFLTKMFDFDLEVWSLHKLVCSFEIVFIVARPYNGQWTHIPHRSSVPLSPPSWTFSLHDSPARPPALWRTSPIPPTTSSSSCHQVEGTGVLQSPCPLLKPRTPQPPHPQLIKTVDNFPKCNSECENYTQVSGLYKPPVVTHSSHDMYTRQFL